MSNHTHQSMVLAQPSTTAFSSPGLSPLVPLARRFASPSSGTTTRPRAYTSTAAMAALSLVTRQNGPIIFLSCVCTFFATTATPSFSQRSTQALIRRQGQPPPLPPSIATITHILLKSSFLLSHRALDTPHPRPSGCRALSLPQPSFEPHHLPSCWFPIAQRLVCHCHCQGMQSMLHCVGRGLQQDSKHRTISPAPSMPFSVYW
ncbi:hypothetical protein DFJ73DRAFT_883436 [Zopfochytrium polystomum]|nr:hypothetical protein DFJ73DRAFT_883436 [Zopfochytrium polystomum]